VRELHARALIARTLFVFLLVAVSCTPAGPRASPSPAGTGPAGPSPTPPSAPPSVELARGPLARAACALPHRHLLRVWRGYDPRRSGVLQIVPREPNIVGPGFPHAGVADHLQDVPLLLYGPEVIESGRTVRRAVTVADVAPTIAELIGFDLPQADGTPLREALAQDSEPPRLVVTLVWDGGGRVVLDEWMDAWPNLRRLIRKGTWYEHASVGSSPSTSAPIHATIGTGAFPRRHGLIGNALRIAGRIADPWDEGPAYLALPSLADLYDAANGNAPLVGLIGSATVQLGLIGHGAMWEGGDRDIAVLKRRRGYENPDGFWGVAATSRRYFSTPGYVNRLPFLTAYQRSADLLDGRSDGAWMGASIEGLRNGYDTPARIPFESRVVEEVVHREGFGGDDVPDLLYLNYKLIDYVGHRWSLHSPQMRQTVQTQDAELPGLARVLDEEVGRGRWVLILTADHGSQPDPTRLGGRRIDITGIEAHIRSRFDDGDGEPLVDQVQTTQVFLDPEELAQNGHTLEQVAASLARLTAADIAAPPGSSGQRVFAAVFPSELMPHLACLPEAREA